MREIMKVYSLGLIFRNAYRILMVGTTEIVIFQDAYCGENSSVLDTDELETTSPVSFDLHCLESNYCEQAEVEPATDMPSEEQHIEVTDVVQVSEELGHNEEENENYMDTLPYIPNFQPFSTHTTGVLPE